MDLLVKRNDVGGSSDLVFNDKDFDISLMEGLKKDAEAIIKTFEQEDTLC